jgi:hypothetical protein
MEIAKLPILYWMGRRRTGTARIFVGKAGLDMYSFYPRSEGVGISAALAKPLTSSESNACKPIVPWLMSCSTKGCILPRTFIEGETTEGFLNVAGSGSKE